jgi:hypothetical protein
VARYVSKLLVGLGAPPLSTDCVCRPFPLRGGNILESGGTRIADRYIDHYELRLTGARFEALDVISRVSASRLGAMQARFSTYI